MDLIQLDSSKNTSSKLELDRPSSSITEEHTSNPLALALALALALSLSFFLFPRLKHLLQLSVPFGAEGAREWIS